MKHIIFTSILIGLFSFATVFADIPEVRWICTTESKPWQEKSSIHPVESTVMPADMQIHPQLAKQEIEGFGGCFNELGWKALAGLSEDAREEVIASLFGEKGCNFTRARTPIGASDFAIDYYSLDDTVDDFDLKHFSIDRDLKCQIPFIKSAMKYQPGLKVWASPWSPPAWMKEDGKYAGGRIRFTPEILKTYAYYLARFVKEYRAVGIDIDAVHVQNEPHIANNYPTCLWTGAQLRDFIRDYAGPVFKEQKVEAQLWLGTINDKDFNSTVGTVLSDPMAAKYVQGIGFQWDGQEIIASARELYPDLPLIQTENECHDGKNSFADAEHTFQLFRKYINGGAQAYFFWNMILQSGGKSSWGWAQNAMITIDTESKQVTYHPEYYLMKHIAHFVPPKSKLIYSTGVWGDKIAFLRPDGSAVVIMGNSSNKEYEPAIGISRDNRTAIKVKVPPHSFNTFVIPKELVEK